MWGRGTPAPGRQLRGDRSRHARITGRARVAGAGGVLARAWISGIAAAGAAAPAILPALGRPGRWHPHQFRTAGMAVNTVPVAPAPRAAAPCPRPKDKGGGGGEAKSPTSGFATIRVDSLAGERPAMTPIGRLILCLG